MLISACARLIERLQRIAQSRELGLVLRRRVFERRKVGRVAQRGQQRLLIADLGQQVAPLGDQTHLSDGGCNSTDSTESGEKLRTILREIRYWICGNEERVLHKFLTRQCKDPARTCLVRS